VSEAVTVCNSEAVALIALYRCVFYVHILCVLLCFCICIYSGCDVACSESFSDGEAECRYFRLSSRALHLSFAAEPHVY